jgi:hypothetical protein
MAAIEAIPEGVDIDERLEELRNIERVYMGRFGRLTGEEARNYREIVREIRSLENLKRRQNRPPFIQRVSSFLTRRRNAPIIPTVEAEPVETFIE